jgi:cobalamin-dependent methionine synthase I
MEAKKFPTSEAALKYACKFMGSKEFHDPFIFSTENSEVVVFDKHELRQECERRSTAPVALAALADYVRKHSSYFVTAGPTMLTPAAKASQEKHIEALADEVDALAEKARSGLAHYQHFNELLGRLHAASFFPDRDLVSAAARALVLNGTKQ